MGFRCSQCIVSFLAWLTMHLSQENAHNIRYDWNNVAHKIDGAPVSEYFGRVQIDKWQWHVGKCKNSEKATNHNSNLLLESCQPLTVEFVVNVFYWKIERHRTQAQIIANVHTVPVRGYKHRDSSPVKSKWVKLKKFQEIIFDIPQALVLNSLVHKNSKPILYRRVPTVHAFTNSRCKFNTPWLNIIHCGKVVRFLLHLLRVLVPESLLFLGFYTFRTVKNNFYIAKRLT